MMWSDGLMWSDGFFWGWFIGIAMMALLNPRGLR